MFYNFCCLSQQIYFNVSSLLIFWTYFLSSWIFWFSLKSSYSAASSLGGRRKLLDENCVEQFISALMGLGGTTLTDLDTWVNVASSIMATYLTPLGILFCNEKRRLFDGLPIKEYKNSIQMCCWNIKQHVKFFQLK